jgi:FtsP/CotA-like multicopper oxidase with cupredoxin domain
MRFISKRFVKEDDMVVKHTKKAVLAGVIAGLAMLATSGTAQAYDPTTQAYVCSPECSLFAESGYIDTPDGGRTYSWGFSDVEGRMRYPGPTIDTVVGQTVTIKLKNNLPDTDGAGPKVEDPVSMIFAGQEGVAFSTDGITFTPVTPHLDNAGSKNSLVSMANHAEPGQTVYYRFTPTRAGSYQYASGTNPHKHIDMGLVGAMIVRPGSLGVAIPGQAYNTPETAYDVEYIQFMTAMDPDQHRRVELGLDYQSSAYLPQYWFINGRAFPDTIGGPTVDPNQIFLANQPDSALIGMYPGERVLMRTINADRDLHPLHHHGNHEMVIGINGHEMTSDGISADLARERYTEVVQPGESVDGIFTWDPEGPGLPDFGWDVSGNDPLRPVPVVVPPAFDNPNVSMIYGDTYSGSPYLGKTGLLPGSVPSINQHGEHYVPFHSHHEHELQNQGEGPGGMLTLIMICQPGQACYNR